MKPDPIEAMAYQLAAKAEVRREAVVSQFLETEFGEGIRLDDVKDRVVFVRNSMKRNGEEILVLDGCPRICFSPVKVTCHRKGNEMRFSIEQTAHLI